MLTQIKDNELQELNGGTGVLETIGAIFALYMGVREIVRDAGRNAAYEDLGM